MASVVAVPPLSAKPVTGLKSPSTADLSGWPLDPRERADFYHPPRAFPPEVARWRRRVVAAALADRSRFPALPRATSEEEIRVRLDAGLAHLREVARIAAALHGTPDLGNKQGPVDELVYIILARKTREDAYQSTFDTLKKRFGTWDELVEAPRTEVAALVHSGGLSSRKTESLFGALGAIRERFGTCTLEPARAWPDDELESLLCSLPEISRKSAYCVMMYAFGRRVFPVDTHVGRVLSRLRPYRELGLSLAGLNHKKLQAVLADLVPPNLRYSLHVNLVAHGRVVCRGPRPLGLRAVRPEEHLRDVQGHRGAARTCRQRADGRRSLLRRRRAVRGIPTCGLPARPLSLDSDPVSLRTYWLNHPEVPDDRVVLRDVRDLRPGELRRLVGRRGVDVLAGAPPCQGFSSVGFRSKRAKTGHRVIEDDRNYLYRYMVRAAVELQPRVVVLENVPGMHSARRQDLTFLQSAARDLEQEAGFRTVIWRLNSAAFGVPQDRVRYFLVAWRSGPAPLEPTGEYRDDLGGDLDVDALPPIRFDEAIFDLPVREAGEGTAVDRWMPGTAVTEPRARRYLLKARLLRDSVILYNHHVRYHNERDLELYRLLRPGEDSVHAIERHGRGDLMRYRRDVFDDKYHKLRPDRPGKTIVAHLAKDGNGYVHPSQNRSITVREAARLQSFHDGYAFCGTPSDQWVQLGNAVPPVLAEGIARALLPLVKGRRRH